MPPPAAVHFFNSSRKTVVVQSIGGLTFHLTDDVVGGNVEDVFGDGDLEDVALPDDLTIGPAGDATGQNAGRIDLRVPVTVGPLPPPPPPPPPTNHTTNVHDGYRTDQGVLTIQVAGGNVFTLRFPAAPLAAPADMRVRNFLLLLEDAGAKVKATVHYAYVDAGGTVIRAQASATEP